MDSMHSRIADDLRRRIATGELRTGDPVPSEAQLSRAHAVSRGTVRQALAALRAEGAIGGGRGKPPVVRPPTLTQDFAELVSFSAWALALGREPGQQTVEVARRPARIDAIDALGLAEGDPVVELLRLRQLDGRPVMVERATFVERVGRLLFDFDPDAGSIYAHLRAAGIDLARARQTIDAVGADARDCELLGVAAGTPLLRVRRRTTDAGGEPLEWADDRYLGDAMSFTLESAAAGAAGVARAA
ncbi:MAG: GntR family transcriptional regulator [Solirubrobacteraceae bacterium]